MLLWTNRSREPMVGRRSGLFGRLGSRTGSGRRTPGAWKAAGTPNKRCETCGRPRAAAPNNPVALRAYAEFLDQHHDPAARENYARLSQLLQRTSAPAEQRAAVAQRLAVLDILAGDREAAARDLQDYSGRAARI